MVATALTDALHARGQRVTAQRVVLHDALTELGRHATAEEIARVAMPRLPGLSLPTVYATLELLAELALVRRVATGGPAVLWDPRPDPHHHFLCRSCGAVADLDAAVDARPALAAARAAGAVPEDADLVVRGRCASCA